MFIFMIHIKIIAIQKDLKSKRFEQKVQETIQVWSTKIQVWSTKILRRGCVDKIVRRPRLRFYIFIK